MGIIVVFILLFLCYWYHSDDFLPSKPLHEKAWIEMTEEEKRLSKKWNEKRIEKLLKSENADKIQKEYEIQQKFKNRKIK